jgi:hypothetical protein
MSFFVEITRMTSSHNLQQRFDNISLEKIFFERGKIVLYLKFFLFENLNYSIYFLTRI